MLERLRKFRQSKLWKPFIAGILLTFFGLGMWGVRSYLRMKTLNDATALVQRGFFALASDRLEADRRFYTTSESGCVVLISVFYHMKRFERLDWASQACLVNGVEIPDAYIGIAISLENNANIDEAIRVLTTVAGKFQNTPQIYNHLGRLLKGKKMHDQAIQAYQEAWKRSQSNAQMGFEILQYFSEQRRWADALPIASTLKLAQTPDPEVKLVLARVFKQTQQESDAKKLIEESGEMLKKLGNQERESMVRRKYSDLFGETGNGTPSLIPAKAVPTFTKRH